MAHTETGGHRCLTLRRIPTEPTEPLIHDPPGVIGPEPPTRPLSQLPPPGNLRLTVHAIKVIGGGRVGKICEAVVKYNASSQETRGMLLPPLIAKVSRPWKTDALAREGFYYEELEYLQGSVVPRYYGVYEATIPDDCNFLLWKKDIESEEANRQDRIKKTGCPYPPPPRPTLVRVLLLERVGERIPLGKPLSPNLK